MTLGGEATAIPTGDIGEEQANITENTEPEQVIGAGSGGGGAPMESDMLSTLALLGGVVGGLGAMALYTMGQNSVTNLVASTYSLPQEEPNLVEVEYPYVSREWTEWSTTLAETVVEEAHWEIDLPRRLVHRQMDPYTDYREVTQYVWKCLPERSEEAKDQAATYTWVKFPVTSQVPYLRYGIDEWVWLDEVKHWVPERVEMRPYLMQREEHSWKTVEIDAGNLLPEVAKEFFKQMDPHLEFWEMEQKFKSFRDGFFALPIQMSQEIIEELVTCYLHLVDGYRIDNTMLPTEFGTGSWSDSPHPEWDGFALPDDALYDTDAAQYLNLYQILLNELRNKDLPTMPAVHHKLCGVLAAIAALGFDLKTGLIAFADLTLYSDVPQWDSEKQDFKTDENGNIITGGGTGADILLHGASSTAGDLVLFLNSVLGDGAYQSVNGTEGHPPLTPEKIGDIISQGKPLIALVSMEVFPNKVNENSIPYGQVLSSEKCLDSVSHFVTLTGTFQDENGEWWVRVYNPFQNFEEVYSWKTFEAAWEKTEENPGLCYKIVVPSGAVP